jgi:hypothetical protein
MSRANRAYRVFGGVLASEIPFPELPAADSEADWVLDTAAEPPRLSNAARCGEDRVAGDVRVRLFRHSNGYRLEFDDTGFFDVAADGKQLLWCAGHASDIGSVRLDVFGRVIPLAMHASGLITLHGSAVSVSGAGIGFLGPKYHGKSTLSQALMRAGALLATDDALPVEAGGEVRMRPGVHRARLWNDSLTWIRSGSAPADGAPRQKHLLEAPSVELLLQESVPLAALYLLAPLAPGRGVSAVERVRLTPTHAALSLVVHAKLGALLGKGEAGVALQRASRIAELVPVYRLELVRDFHRLPEVVDALLEWHSATIRA